MKNFVKSVLIGKGPNAYTIRYGTAKGIKMFIDPQGGSLRIFGLDETELLPYVRKFSAQCEIFIDIGSSDGYYPLIYRKFNTTGEIFSVEVDPNRAVDQPKNFQLNKLDQSKLHIIQKYVSDRNDENNITVDRLVTEKGKNIFIKIDIEGAELIALNGAKDLLKSNKCYLIIETHSKELENQCGTFLKELGYSTEIIKPAWFRRFVPESRELEHNRWLLAHQ